MMDKRDFELYFNWASSQFADEHLTIFRASFDTRENVY